MSNEDFDTRTKLQKLRGEPINCTNIPHRVLCSSKLFDRDLLIEFQEKEHIYLVKGEKMKRSVTQLIDSFFPKFDATKVSSDMLSKKDFFKEEKYAKYHTMLNGIDITKDKQKAMEIIRESWKQNGANVSKEGTDMHASIERYYTQKECAMPAIPETFHFFEFDKYARSLGYIPFKSEQIVWSTDHSLAGSVDMLYSKPGPDFGKVVWLVDWKKSKRIDMKGFNERSKGLGLLQKRDNCNYVKYSLQLNIYKYMSETFYGLIVERMTIVVFHYSNSNYLKYEVEDDSKMVNVIFDEVKAEELSRSQEKSMERKALANKKSSDNSSDDVEIIVKRPLRKVVVSRKKKEDSSSIDEEDLVEIKRKRR